MMTPTTTTEPAPPRLRRLAVWAAVLALLALVFASYLNPHRVVELANQLWACF